MIIGAISIEKKTPGSKTWQPAIDSNKGSPVELTAELKSP